MLNEQDAFVHTVLQSSTRHSNANFGKQPKSTTQAIFKFAPVI